MRQQLTIIPDSLSPNFATCEHCGKPIGWDDYSYTHLHSGFVECDTVVSGGTEGIGVRISPEISTDPALSHLAGKRAEPSTWYEDVTIS